MAIHREFADGDKDPGLWHDYGTDRDTGKLARVRIRAIPAAVEDRLRREHGLRQTKQTIRVRKGASEIELEVEKEKELARARAAYALRETENWSIRPGDEAAAETYGTLTGAPATTEADLVLDTCWDRPGLKAHYFREHADFVTWILERVDNERASTIERQEELRGNS